MAERLKIYTIFFINILLRGFFLPFSKNKNIILKFKINTFAYYVRVYY